MDFGLAGKRAVVTGASKGIGLAITRALVSEGARVIAGARDETDELRTLVAGRGVRSVSVDLATADGPAELMRAATAEGGIDVLVNNVGAVNVRTDGFAAIDDDEWLATWNLTFMAAVRTTRAALPALREADRAGPRGVAQSVANATGASAQDVIAQQSSKAATGRFTTPEEVADLVVLLAGERAANVPARTSSSTAA
jgi:NAD(P)-dependent dehydrogenase (short-subunit alcohol dehydrogenase family)